MPIRHYILDGHEPILEPDLLEWARWFETADRTVARFEEGGVLVSTIFLGLDHGFFDWYKPILFETMVFNGTLHGEQTRCSTWSEAEAMHEEMVERVKRSHRQPASGFLKALYTKLRTNNH